MNTYSMNTTQAQINEVVEQLTAKGRETMRAVGAGETSFFDEGIREGSGIWGECLTQELGHKSSGVINRLKALGLWTTTPGEPGEGDYWMLTALGADVANFLAGTLDWQVASERIGLKDETPAEELQEAPSTTVKRGAKWTYLYAADGTLIAELRNDQFEAIAAFLK